MPRPSLGGFENRFGLDLSDAPGPIRIRSGIYIPTCQKFLNLTAYSIQQEPFCQPIRIIPSPLRRHPVLQSFGDTIGNYQIGNRVSFKLVNGNQTEFKAFDFEFGRSGADAGIVYRVANGTQLSTDEEVDLQQIRTDWAGPNQDGGLLYDSMLDGPITVPPCGEVYISARLAILGNSSLPYQTKTTRAT